MAGVLVPRAQPQARANCLPAQWLQHPNTAFLKETSGVDSHFLCLQLGSLKSVAVLQG